jgi:lysyl-tRNA synthetase, class II
MSAEETLIQIRKEKHQDLNGGTYPLSTTERVTSVAHLLQDLDEINSEIIPTTISLEEVRLISRILHGRLTALRKSGALTFMKLMDATGSIQLVAARNNFQDYDRFKLLDLGDIVEVTGKPVLTKTGERSLLLSNWRVLTKAHRPPPEKFHGIADDELKARKRYLDLMGSEETRARFVVRSTILQAIRRCMDHNGFMEVETSTMSSIASGANAKPFTTHHNALDIDLRLRIAPELNLKRLLVGGFEKVFEIGRSYRNEGIDTRHNPEFTMMESYQAYGRFSELITSTKSLLQFVVTYCDFHLPAWAKEHFVRWRAEKPFTFTQFAEVKMFEAVVTALQRAGLDVVVHNNSISDIQVLDKNNPRLQKIDLAKLTHDMSITVTSGEKLYLLFEQVAEPFLTEDYRSQDKNKSLPVFITSYPKEVSPLARSNDNPLANVVDRFELFVDGRELANAFQELNDPDEQARRFKEQLEANKKDPMDYDADYIEALEHGMPPAIGFGMGIDRLVMLLTNAASIKDVILFPTLRPEK